MVSALALDKGPVLKENEMRDACLNYKPETLARHVKNGAVIGVNYQELYDTMLS